MENFLRKKLPVGVEDFKTIETQCYYVDKSLLIKEMIDRVDGSVTLFTRPRRFGKSLALSMLDYFFSENHRDEKDLFSELAIAKETPFYLNEQGRYPLIHFNFKNISGLTYGEMSAKIRQAVSEETSRHEELKESTKLSAEQRDLVARLIKGEESDSELSSSARLLSELLYRHWGIKAILLIDEYDAPIERAREQGFYDESVNFFRSFYGESLKGNVSLRFAALTGVLQISKESLFSGLNNLVVDSVLGGTYSEYFGFAEPEVRAMLSYFGFADKFEEVALWYDGYRFGNAKLFNPWSVINYLFHDGQVDAYWIDTGENSILAELLFPKDFSHGAALAELLGKGSIKLDVSSPLTFRDLPHSDSALLSFLLSTGYLTWLDRDTDTGERTLSFPNFETARLFQNEVIKRYATFEGENWTGKLRQAFESRDEQVISDLLTRYLVSGFSSFDYGVEKNYQCLLLGMASVLFSEANVSSEVNAGEGRCDILIAPKNPAGLGIIIEVKNNASRQSSKNLKTLASNALKQIEERHYQAILEKVGAKEILGYGIAFFKQKAETVSRRLL